MKKEKEDSNSAMMKAMAESLEAIKINLADNRKSQEAFTLTQRQRLV